MRITLADSVYCPMNGPISLCCKDHCAVWQWASTSSESGETFKSTFYSVSDFYNTFGIEITIPAYPEMSDNDDLHLAWESHLEDLIKYAETWLPENVFGREYELYERGFDEDEYCFYAHYKYNLHTNERFGYCGMVPCNSHIISTLDMKPF